MMVFKPTFLIVPGAWHPPSCYTTLAKHLKTAGYPTNILTYPSLNTKDPLTATCAADAESLRQQIIPVIEKDGGRDVVVVCHSYGGIPGGGAAQGLSKSTRVEEGKEGGVLGLICICAIIVPEGKSLGGFMGEHAPYLKVDNPSQGYCIISPVVENFYHDVEASIARDLEKSLLPMPFLAFESPSPPSAWAEPAYAGKLAYLKCTQDVAIPPFVQEHFMEKSKAKWMTRNIDSSHSPFASRPHEVAKILVDWAETFQGIHP